MGGCAALPLTSTQKKGTITAMKSFLCKSLLIPLAFLLSAAPIHAQTAADIEELLGTEAISCEEAAWLVLAVALETPPADRTAAFTLAREQGWFPENTEGASHITMSGLSLLLMKSFDLTGGLMYRITGNRRYAFREMRARGFISGRAYPNFSVSGEQFLQILENVSAEQDGDL